jgi:hypothetical protein
MLPGVPHEARWTRREPRRTLPPEILDRIVHTAFPRCSVVEMQPLGDGLRNANFKLCLDGQPEPVVLRIYEHDASICRKDRGTGRTHSRNCRRSRPGSDVTQPREALLSYIGWHSYDCGSGNRAEVSIAVG